MAITNLTGTTWTLNDYCTTGVYYSSSASETKVYINYQQKDDSGALVRDNTYFLFRFTSNHGFGLYNSNSNPFYSGTASTSTTEIQWALYNIPKYYLTVYITGGSDATNAKFISWIQANAKQLVSVTNNVSHCTLSPLSIYTGSTYTGTLTVASGYSLPSTVMVGNNYYAVTNGQFTIPASDITGDFTISNTAGVTKNIQMHPIINGAQEQGVNLYPKTIATNVNGLSDLLATKQSTLSTTQLAAVNSNITATKVSSYDAYSTSKQDTLINQSNIKSINGESILGSGNISIQSGGGNVNYDEVFDISYNLTNVSASNKPSQIISDEESTQVSITFVADSGYVLPTDVTISGCSYSWSQSSGVLSLSDPTTNVNVTIEGK